MGGWTKDNSDFSDRFANEGCDTARSELRKVNLDVVVSKDRNLNEAHVIQRTTWPPKFPKILGELPRSPDNLLLFLGRPFRTILDFVDLVP